MPITYNPDTNTIVITGGTASEPLTFEDIYNADVANNWGVFTKVDEKTYKSTAKLQFGDGVTETYFEESGSTLIMDGVAQSNGDKLIVFKALTHATFGEKVMNDGAETGQDGVLFVFREPTYNYARMSFEEGADVKFYGCVFKTEYPCNAVLLEYFSGVMLGCYVELRMYNPRNATLKWLVLANRYGQINSPENCVMEHIRLITAYYVALIVRDTDLVFRNVECHGIERLANVWYLSKPHVVKFVDCYTTNWEIHWNLPEGNESGELLWCYTIRFKLMDKDGNPLSGRTVRIYDKDGTLLAELTTDENGLTGPCELVYRRLVNPYADGEWHVFYEEDWETFAPYTIEVWHGNEQEWRGRLEDVGITEKPITITYWPPSETLDRLLSELEAHRAVEPDITLMRKIQTNRWKIENNQLVIYDDDGVTPLKVFNLKDKYGNPSEVNVYEREPV